MQSAAEPSLIVSFYTFGIFKKVGNVEYPIEPMAVAKALASNIPEEEFNTGLLTDDLLSIWQRGVKRVVISYRKPQMTGIWLENAENAARVPMPGLVMVRITRENGSPDYRLYAVKERPTAKTQLYYCPLPHVSRDGSCWGTVRVPDAKTLTTNNLQSDWDAFLGSRFGSHSVNGKSVSHSDDIRKLYVKLHEKKARKYPMRELVSLEKSFGTLLSEVCK
jgi:PRTRC genetic system protein B